MNNTFVAYIKTNGQWVYWVYNNGHNSSPTFKSKNFSSKQEAVKAFASNFTDKGSE